jgi:putative membrane protein insertion efficiency factor
MNQRARSFVVWLLKGYKWALSPLMLPACRYVPTCSDYAMEAVERYGVWRGGVKGMGRVLRCHPFVRGGYDPVVRVPVMQSEVVEFERYDATASAAPPASCAVTE